MISHTFKPWIGDQYSSPSNLFGPRVLVLGESHYGPSGAEHPEDTIRTVHLYTQGGARHAFFTKVAKVLRGMDRSKWLSPEELATTYQHIAFYNYVPCYAGDWARQRPTAEMWEAGRAPFMRVLQDYKPEIVVVLGKALDTHVPELPQGVRRVVINHPSSAGFSYEDWQPLVRDALMKKRDKKDLDN